MFLQGVSGDIMKSKSMAPYGVPVTFPNTAVLFHHFADVQYNSSGVTVKTSTGEFYQADFALMTFPLGVLQNDVVNFIPEMPRWKREPIFKVDVAHYAHVFLKFDEKFWDDEEWLLYAHSRKGYYPMFSGFDSHLTEKQFQGKDIVYFVFVFNCRTFVHLTFSTVNKQNLTLINIPLQKLCCKQI